MAETRIRAIVTDLDGVIRHFPAHRDSEIEQRYGLPLRAISEAAFEPALLQQVVTGSITDEVWRSRIRNNLSSKHPGSDISAAMNEWSDYPGTVDMDTLGLLQQVAPSPLALLTNATSRLESDLEKLKIRSAFGVIFNSSKLGVAKPAAEVFVKACAMLQLPPREILFIDDSEKNILAAKEIGMQGIKFSDRETLQICLTKMGF